MKNLRNKVKEAAVAILLGCLIAIVPFYFETKAMTDDNRKLNVVQDADISLLKEDTEVLNINQAIEKVEIEHNKEILLRIEKKVDELREEVKALD